MPLGQVGDLPGFPYAERGRRLVQDDHLAAERRGPGGWLADAAILTLMAVLASRVTSNTRINAALTEARAREATAPAVAR